MQMLQYIRCIATYTITHVTYFKKSKSENGLSESVKNAKSSRLAKYCEVK